MTKNIVFEAIPAQPLILLLVVFCNKNGILNHKIDKIHPSLVEMPFEVTKILKHQFDNFLLFFGESYGLRSRLKVTLFSLNHPK